MPERRTSDANLRKVVKSAVIGYITLWVGLGAAITVGQHNDSNARKRDRDNGKAVITTIVRSGNIVAVEGCNRDFISTNALRGVFKAAQKALKRNLSNGLITQSQYDEAIKFYTAQLKTLPLPDCRDATKILNSNPNSPQRLIVPLYPEKDG